jgi:hypothetical protein
MKRLVLLVAFLAAVAVTTELAYAKPGGGDGPKHDAAHGTAHSTITISTGDVDFDVHVNATSGPLGEDARGHFFFRRSGGGPTIPEFDLRGRVTCLTVVANRATVGGIIEKSRQPTAQEGQGFTIIVEDNGSPGGDPVTPDRWTASLGPTPPVVCPPPPTTGLIPVEQGNFVVQEAGP